MDRLRERPTGNECVDLDHEAPRLSQSDDHTQVVLNIVCAQYATLAVLEPLIEWSVATNGHSPCLWLDAFKGLRVDCGAGWSYLPTLVPMLRHVAPQTTTLSKRQVATVVLSYVAHLFRRHTVMCVVLQRTVAEQLEPAPAA